MDDKWLRDRLAQPTIQTPIIQQASIEDPVMTAATAVMCSYQNANKWLDIIKECILMDIGCVFFSTHVHNLAHTMPVRFDKFGDILHTCDIKIPYPATEYIPSEPSDILGAFECIFNTLDAIKSSLCEFIKCTQDTPMHGMSCAAETLLNDIESEYPTLYRMRRAYQTCCEDSVKFDDWVNRYINNQSQLLG